MFELHGGDACEAALSLIRLPRQKLPRFAVSTAEGERIRPRHSEDDRIDYRIPANGRIMLSW